MAEPLRLPGPLPVPDLAIPDRDQRLPQCPRAQPAPHRGPRPAATGPHLELPLEERPDLAAPPADLPWLQPYPDHLLDRVAPSDLEIPKLKQQPGKDIGISGSVALVRSLLRQGLLDRLQLQVYPVALGATGTKPIFEGFDRTTLRLADSRVLDGQVVQLDYDTASTSSTQP